MSKEDKKVNDLLSKQHPDLPSMVDIEKQRLIDMENKDNQEIFDTDQLGPGYSN